MRKFTVTVDNLEKVSDAIFTALDGRTFSLNNKATDGLNET